MATSGRAPSPTGQFDSRDNARKICFSASWPCTATSSNVTRNVGQRRRSTETMSRSAAPVRELITAT